MCFLRGETEGKGRDGGEYWTGHVRDSVRREKEEIREAKRESISAIW